MEFRLLIYARCSGRGRATDDVIYAALYHRFDYEIGGGNFGNIHEVGGSFDIQTGKATPFDTTVKANLPANLGFVVGGDVELAAGRLRISPQVRYTFWMSNPVSGYFGDGASFQSNSQQVDVVVGISWKVR